MPIDTSIYAQFLRPPKSVADYDAQARAGQLDQLQLLDAQDKRDAGVRQRQRADQLQQLVRGVPATASDEDRIAALKSGGFYGEADALGKSLDERAKARAATAKDTADAQGKTVDTQRKLFEHTITGLQQFTQPEDARQWLADSVAGGAMSMKRAQAMMSGVPRDPAEFSAWRDRTLMSALDAGKAAGFVAPDANARLTATTSRANNADNNARQAADAAAGRAVTMRGQTMANDRARETNGRPFEGVDANGDPAMFVMGRDGTAQPLAGVGPKAAKLKDIPASANKTLVEGVQGVGNIDAAIAAVKANPDALGWKNAIPGADMVRQRTDPGGVAARAKVANIGSLVLHDRSGAAVSASEFPRLRPFIPLPSDDANAAIKKLEQMRQIAAEELGLYADTYGPQGGYKAHPLAGRIRGLAAPPSDAMPAAATDPNDPVAAALRKYGGP